MPSTAVALRTVAAHQTSGTEGAGTIAFASPSILPGRLRSVLAWIAGVAESGTPLAVGDRPVARRPRQNLCEFDYDYYVALQAGRRHPPVRLNRRGRSGA